MIEGDLKKLRLVASAEPVRERILSAARSARKDQLIDRCIALGAAAACLVIVAFTADGASSHGPPRADRIATELGAPDLSGALGQALLPPDGHSRSWIDDLP